MGRMSAAPYPGKEGAGIGPGVVLEARTTAHVEVDHQGRRDVGAGTARLEALQLVQRAVQHTVQPRLVLREQCSQSASSRRSQPSVRS
jgi:hypothetical protein